MEKVGAAISKEVVRRKLHSLKLKDGESVQDHVKTMVETFNELSIVGDAITTEDRVVYLLASLPDTFGTLVTALEANPTVPEMDVVIERLMYEERKLKERDLPSESKNAEALATRHRYSGNLQSRSKGPKCYRCQKHGHIQRNCPQGSTHHHQANHSNRKSGMKPNEVHQTQTRRDSSEDEVGLLTAHEAVSTMSPDQTMERWIIDSGATCHLQ